MRSGSERALDYFAFAVSSLDHLERLTEALRTKFDVKKLDAPLFGECVMLTDPDGNRICFGVPASETAGSSPIPVRLQHIGLATPNLEALLAFYCGVGWNVSDLVRDDAQALTAAFLRSDPEHHSLALFRTGQSKLDHFCHETSDWNCIRDWADHFAANGVRIEWGAGRHGAGNNLFIFVLDPDRNAIEISAELECWPDDRPSGVWRHEERTLNLWGSAWMRS